MDLLLVYPNNRARAYGALGDRIAAITPPLQAALIAACARRAGLSVSVLDAEAEGLDAAATAARVQSASPRLCLLSTDALNSGDVTKMAAASETAAAIRASAGATPVALEGVVPSAYPERILRTEPADYVCLGEAYGPAVALVAALGAGTPRPAAPVPGVAWLDGDRFVTGGRPPLVKNPDDLPEAAWDLLPVARYRAHHWHCFGEPERRQPYASLYTNLGCPYTCTFCNVNVVYGGPNFRARSPERVAEEVDRLVREHGVRNIRIVDNVFTIRPDLCERLCDLLIRRGHDLNMWCYARVETVKNPELLRKMRKAGIRWIAYGIEAASERVREGVDKGSDQATIDRAIDRTREAGIHIVGNFIFGLPDDTQETMRETLQMAKAYNFEHANFYVAMAYPGTPLHDWAVKEGIPLPARWSGFGQYSEDALPLATRSLAPSEVVRFRDEAFREYFSDPAYLSLLDRTFGPKAVECVREILSIRLPRERPAGARLRAPDGSATRQA